MVNEFAIVVGVVMRDAGLFYFIFSEIIPHPFRLQRPNWVAYFFLALAAIWTIQGHLVVRYCQLGWGVQAVIRQGLRVFFQATRPLRLQSVVLSRHSGEGSLQRC